MKQYKVSKEDNVVERYSKEWELKDQGYREGKEEGIEENKRGIMKTAFFMLKEGLDLSLIKKITGLTETEILSIEEKYNV